MTKEELEKEAEEKYIEVDREFIACQDEGEVFNIGYVLGAEPREKQIQIDAEQIRALQKQNGELIDELTLTNNECKDMREELKQRIRENQKLCEQIEKMKCCDNCKFKNCNKSSMYQTCWYCKNKDKWKLGR